jgi:hypothetical protein
MKEGAKDFRSGQKFEGAAFFDEYVDIHHVFPQAWCEGEKIDAKTYDSIINKSPLSYRTNRILGGSAPSGYLTKLQAGDKKNPPIPAEVLDGFISSHCIDPKILRSDKFDAFLKDREARLLALIAKVTGHRIIEAEPSDGEEVPDDIAQDSGLLPTNGN